MTITNLVMFKSVKSTCMSLFIIHTQSGQKLKDLLLHCYIACIQCSCQFPYIFRIFYYKVQANPWIHYVHSNCTDTVLKLNENNCLVLWINRLSINWQFEFSAHAVILCAWTRDVDLIGWDSGDCALTFRVDYLIYEFYTARPFYWSLEMTDKLSYHTEVCLNIKMCFPIHETQFNVLKIFARNCSYLIILNFLILFIHTFPERYINTNV